MKNVITFIFCFSFSFFILSCKSSELTLIISSINKMEPVYSEEEALFYAKKIDNIKKIADSCKNNNLDCYIHFHELNPNYRGGIGKFREDVYNNINIPRNERPSKYTVNFIVGRNDSIEIMQVHGIDNSKMKNEISRVMNLDSIRKFNWTSGSLFNRKIKYEYEIEVELYKKNKIFSRP